MCGVQKENLYFCLNILCYFIVVAVTQDPPPPDHAPAPDHAP